MGIPPKNLDIADLKMIYLFVFTNHSYQSIRTKVQIQLTPKETHLYTQLRYVCVHGGERCSTTCKLLGRIVAPNNQVIQSHHLVRLHRTWLRGPPTQLEYEMFHFFRLWEHFFFSHLQYVFWMSICQAEVPQDVPLQSFRNHRVHINPHSITVTLNKVQYSVAFYCQKLVTYL